MNRRHLPKLMFMGLLLFAVGWLLLSGAYRDVEPAKMREAVRATGPLAPLAFVLALTFVQPLGVSGHVFVLTASMVWTPWLAFGLSLLGCTLGQCLYFAVYRYLARDWARAHMPERLMRYEQVLVRRPLASILALRLVAFTWPVAPVILAASAVTLPPMVLGTVLGLAPMTAIDVWLGGQIVAWLS